MSLWKLLSCPYCGDEEHWIVIGLVGGAGQESIQAQCNKCRGVFELVVSERREYDNWQHLKKIPKQTVYCPWCKTRNIYELEKADVAYILVYDKWVVGWTVVCPCGVILSWYDIKEDDPFFKVPIPISKTHQIKTDRGGPKRNSEERE